MTIGDKIKYCRTRNRISQSKLAELSGISLVSIKRYETNKAIPLEPQIKKLADALGIGALAFSDTYFDCLRELETYGDFIRLLIIFRKNHLIQVGGKRDENGHILSETAIFKINPIIGRFFAVEENRDIQAKNISLCLTNNRVLENFLKWESAYTKYESLVNEFRDSKDEKVIALLDENDKILGRIELELQYDNILLECVDGHITVKIAPEQGNEYFLSELREKTVSEELKSTKSKRKKAVPERTTKNNL